VLLVLVFHAAHNWLRGGYVGVDVFFVLSGFLITALLIGEWGQTHSISLPAFYRRRVARLLPALVLFLLATGMLLVFVAKARGSAPYLYGVIGAIAFANNWVIVADGSALGIRCSPRGRWRSRSSSTSSGRLPCSSCSSEGWAERPSWPSFWWPSAQP
jgi:peptidoglycan/LPS O-acetylase OafA/YrhL